MIPPGLAFASVSQKALDFVEARPGGRYYFDWVKTAKSQRKGNSPFTPAVNLFMGLDVALDMIEEEGLDNVFARHDLLARATRAGVAALGLELYGNPDERSTVVTALELPETIDGNKVPGALRKLGITANGGQDHLKGKILRIAHCGYFGAFDILTSLSRHRDGAGPARPRRRARRRRRRGPARLPRGRGSGGGMTTLTEPYRVLVAEKIAETGVDMLRERFDVDLGTDWSRADLLERIGSYHGILIRSATKLDAEVIERADNLRVVGRAGVGVDNVDVAAASKRGIIVANAPEANTVAAAEHTVALMLALARNIPQAHASLTSGKWERSKFGGTEVEGKTLGVLGFGRIGQLVAIRARAFGMHVVAFDPFVTTERFRELGVEQGRVARRRAQGRRLHHAAPARRRPRRRASSTRTRSPSARTACGSSTSPAARWSSTRTSRPRWTTARSPAPRSTCSRRSRSPTTRCSATPTSSSRRTWAPSTAEAQDRAGVQTAEQVVAALTGGVVSTAVNIPAVSAEDMEVLGPFIPLALRLGRIAAALAEPERRARRGRAHGPDRRARHAPAHAVGAQRRVRRPHRGGRQPRQRADAGRGARDRRLRAARGDRARLRRPDAGHAGHRRASACASSARRSATGTARTCSRPGASASTSRSTTRTWRCSATATCRAWSAASARSLGEHGINISAAAVGRQEDGARSDLAVMAVTTDVRVPDAVVGEIAGSDGFVSGRSLSL